MFNFFHYKNKKTSNRANRGQIQIKEMVFMHLVTDLIPQDVVNSDSLEAFG